MFILSNFVLYYSVGFQTFANTSEFSNITMIPYSTLELEIIIDLGTTKVMGESTLKNDKDIESIPIDKSRIFSSITTTDNQTKNPFYEFTNITDSFSNESTKHFTFPTLSSFSNQVSIQNSSRVVIPLTKAHHNIITETTASVFNTSKHIIPFSTQAHIIPFSSLEISNVNTTFKIMKSSIFSNISISSTTGSTTVNKTSTKVAKLETEITIHVSNNTEIKTERTTSLINFNTTRILLTLTTNDKPFIYDLVNQTNSSLISDFKKDSKKTTVTEYFYGLLTLINLSIFSIHFYIFLIVLILTVWIFSILVFVYFYLKRDCHFFKCNEKNNESSLSTSTYKSFKKADFLIDSENEINVYQSFLSLTNTDQSKNNNRTTSTFAKATDPLAEFEIIENNLSKSLVDLDKAHELAQKVDERQKIKRILAGRSGRYYRIKKDEEDSDQLKDSKSIANLDESIHKLEKALRN